MFNATLRPDYPRERDPVGIVKLKGNGFVKNERYHFVYIDGILLAGLNGERLYSGHTARMGDTKMHTKFGHEGEWKGPLWDDSKMNQKDVTIFQRNL